MNKNEKKVILTIDTSSNVEVEVGLVIGKKKDKVRQLLDRKKAQVLLPLIEMLLMKNGLTPQDITGIRVVLGPGSFTGLRVGISIANSLGVFLQIPINGEPVGKLAEPVYS